MLRFRTCVVLAMMLVAAYVRFPHDSIPQGVQTLRGNLRYTNNGWRFILGPGLTKPLPKPEASPPQEQHPVQQEDEQPQYHQYQTFEEEYEDLGSKKDGADQIFGGTVDNLVEADDYHPSSLEVLATTGSSIRSGNKTIKKFNPYPKYNSDQWKSANQGSYVECDGAGGQIQDMLVFSGHSKALERPPMGSYEELGIDSNLCFERQTRLGPYGHVDEEEDIFIQQVMDSAGISSGTQDWDNVNWGHLQKQCYEKNAGRYRKSRLNKTDRDHNTSKRGTRTALLLRAYTGMIFTDNEKQNIRALVTELSLKSGGEYEVFLLVQLKDPNFRIEGNKVAYQDAIKTYIPREFWDMSVLWTDARMKALYPKLSDEYQNVHKSQWFSVQAFAQDHPSFDYFWNWELDSRYTGHHYDLLEKLARFSKAQPRKGLWERNNRYYIPKFHGSYSTKFREQVANIYGSFTVWGAPSIPRINPKGPKPPTAYPEGDQYSWGVGEEADYISLAPIFNPQTTGWIDQNMMLGYQGAADTARRATIGTQSRCSRNLLKIMHMENKRGNHVSSEMTPQTVAFHHGFKAVYAPIPMWFDREWDPSSLNKWFNPGDDGDSGGGGYGSPFSWGGEGKFSGSTWYYRAVSPMRLWNNWLGWEDTGVGGALWEKSHGRACHPPMLLHPIKDVEKTTPGFKSNSPLPY